MRILVGSDDKTVLTDHVVQYLKDRGIDVDVMGALKPGDEKLWPYVGYAAGKRMLEEGYDTAIILCWTGTGVSIAANKVPGVRSALCLDAETARGARLWDDANVLAMSIRSTSTAEAEEIIDAWLELPTGTRDEEDNRSLAMMADIEAEAASRSNA